jgi:hypothetical protein
MPLNQSDYIALGAVAVSVLSALYSRWSANEAKRANQIALHIHKIKIYEEALSFSDCFRGIFTVPSAQRLEQFRQNAVQKSEIYLSEKTYLQLKEIYEHCSDSEIWLIIATSEKTDDVETPNELVVRQEYKSVLNLLYPAIEIIKTEAKI